MLPLDTHGVFMKASGCVQCRGTGYRGRKAISEILLMDDTLRDLIVSRASLIKIKAHARASGTRLLRDAALACVLRVHAGRTEPRHAGGLIHVLAVFFHTLPIRVHRPAAARSLLNLDNLLPRLAACLRPKFVSRLANRVLMCDSS